MSIEVWADNATGTLGAPGTTGDTTISVAQATGVFPSSLSGGEVFHLVIDFDTINAEIVEVTANSGSVEAGWTMTLEAPGLANDHNGPPSAAQVALIITSEGLDSMVAESVLLATYTTEGDLVYATGDAVVTRLAIGADGDVLTSDGTVPSWGNPATLIGDADGDVTGPYSDLEVASIQGVVISGTPTAGDGLFATSDTAAAWSAITSAQVAAAIFDNAGDLFVGTGTDTGEILPIGSAGTALVVGGADPSGLEWGWPSLPTDSNVLTGSTVTATANSLVTILTTATLDAGIWLITVNALVAYDPAAINPVLLVLEEDTATATFNGPFRSQGPYPSGSTDPVPITLTALAVVTVSGTIDIDIFNIDASHAATVEYQDNEGSPNGAVTGYTAVKVA